jgi:hypothetical protein
VSVPTTDFTRCGTFGHAWFDVDSSHWQTDRGTPLTLRCERCMTERRDVISRTTGELVGRHYIYPSGYHYSAGARPSRDDFRLALLALRLREARRDAKRKAS